MVQKKQSIDMTSGGLFVKIIRFAIPLIFTGILQALFNAADLVVVGKYAGENELAAVGSTGSLINLIINFAIGFSIGASVVASIYIGAKDREKVKKTVSNAIFLAIVCGIICMFLGIIFAPFLLSYMGTPSNVISQAITYFKIYFYGAPAIIIYNFSASILRAAGETKKPLLFLSLSGILNVVLNLIFVIYFKMGAAGVGLATTISQYLAMALVLRELIKTDEIYKLTQIKPSWDILKKILLIGIPSGIQGMIFSISNILIQSSINTFGSAVVAGHSAASNIQGFTYIIYNAIANTATTIVGQNFGAKQYKRINKAYIECILFCTGAGIVCGLIFMLLSNFLVKLYLPDADIPIQYAKKELYIMLPTYFLCGIMEIGSCVLRGLGKSALPMTVSILGVCGIRIVWIYTVFAHFKTYESIFLSYPVSWVVTFLAHLTVYLLIKNKIKAKCLEEGQVI